MQRRERGFTLIELMITVVIIGILASIAYPTYTRYVERSRLTDGQVGLMQAASEMERCYTANYSYDVTCLKTTSSPEDVYTTIRLAESGSAYLLEATGGTRVPDGCETLWLRSNGTRGAGEGGGDEKDGVDGGVAGKCWN